MRTIFSVIIVCALSRALTPADFQGSLGGAELRRAYDALPSTGGVVRLDHDISITASQTLLIATGKPLFLDLNGHSIICSNSSGACLTILKPDASPRYPLVISQGRFVYCGSSPGITGLVLGAEKNPITNISLRDLAINGFDTAGSVGLSLVLRRMDTTMRFLLPRIRPHSLWATLQIKTNFQICGFNRIQMRSGRLTLPKPAS